MKIFIQILFFISITFLSYGQYEKGRYQVDSLQIFSKDKLTYKFNIFGSSQGLYFDSTIYSHLPRIKVKIFNNTNDTIIWKYKEHDDHLMWLRTGGRRDTLHPNEYFELESAWAGYNHGYGPVSSTIDAQYQTKGAWKNCRIYTWGSLFPEGYTFNKVDVNIDTNRTQAITLEIPAYDISKDTLSGLHYWTLSGKKKINSNKINYYTPRLASDGYKWVGEKGKRYLDSLNTLVTAYGASIKWAKAEGMIISCDPQKSPQISNLIGKRELQIMLNSWEWLNDSYRIEFKNDLTKEEILKIFKPFGIEPKIQKGGKVIYIQLGNSPVDNNNPLTDQLARVVEIQSINQTKGYTPPVTN